METKQPASSNQPLGDGAFAAVFGETHSFGRPVSYEPRAYLEEYAKRQAPADFLANLPSLKFDRERVPDWRQCYRWGYPPFGAQPDFEEVEFFTQHFLSLYENKTGHPFLRGDETTEELVSLDDSMASFFANPTGAAAATHPLLKEIPDAVEIAQASSALRSAMLAKAALREEGLLFVLESETEAPESLGQGMITCYLHLETDTYCTSRDEIDNMQFWDYRASYVLRTAGKETPLAIMGGTYVALFKEDEWADSGSFHYWMDAHTAFLNDVWKVVTYEFLPSQGLGDVEDYMAHYALESSIATVELTLAPEFRGHRLTPYLLKLFNAALMSYHAQRQGSGATEASMPNIGLPGIFVFPVAGTRPGENERLVNPLLNASPAKVKRKVVDYKTEITKSKLTRYFESLDGEIDEHVVVYDPWEYPST